MANEWQVLADQFAGCGDITLRWSYNGELRSMTGVVSDWGGPSTANRYVAIAKRAGELLGGKPTTPESMWYESLEQMRPHAIVTTDVVEVLNGDQPAILRCLELRDAAAVSRQLATELAAAADNGTDDDRAPDDDAMLSAARLADITGDNPEALRKRLDRYRKANMDGWIENTERGPNDPRYVYRYGAVKHLLKK